MASTESTGHVTDDVTWSRKFKLVTQIGLVSPISWKQVEMLFSDNR